MDFDVLCLLSGHRRSINNGDASHVVHDVEPYLEEITERLDELASETPIGDRARLALVDLGLYGIVMSARATHPRSDVGLLDHTDLRPRYDNVWQALEELGLDVRARLIPKDGRVILFALGPEGTRPTSLS